MRKVINLVLILITLILTYWLYSSIREPIAFHAERDKRKDAVVAVLKKIQVAQDVYRMVTGKYAANFDSLSSVLKNGKIEVAKSLISQGIDLSIVSAASGLSAEELAKLVK